MRICTDRIALDEFYASSEALFRSLGFHKEEIAATEAGAILAWSRHAGAGRPTVYLSAGIHGDEPAGPLAIERFWQKENPSDVNWLVCPMLNPTGFAALSRDNRHGFDLNRDYLLRRSQEIHGHADWLEKQSVPDLFLSLHEDWETQGFYLYEISLGDDQPHRARGLLEAVREVCPIEENAVIDDHVVREPGWIHHEPHADFPDAWPEAIFLAKRGCPLSFTFETPSCAAPVEKRIAAHGAAIRKALQFLV
ncbi:MAG: hypothetical protein RI957_1441 [Verrucomicrobiota bacterium]